MSLLQVIPFLSDNNEKTILTTSFVSPLYRLALLNRGHVTLGACRYSLDGPSMLQVSLQRDVCDPPVRALYIPLARPKVHFSAKDTSVSCLSEALNALAQNQFCCIEVDFTDEPNELEQQLLSKCLSSLLSTTERLEVSFLRSCDGWKAPAGLKRLELRAFVGEATDLLQFIAESQLEELHIYDCATFAQQKNVATQIPCSITDLCLNGSNCTDDLFAGLTCPQNLCRLSLDDCENLTELDLSAMTALSFFSAARTHLHSDVLPGLVNCTHLTHLNLSACHELHDVNMLSGLTGLRELFVHETSVTNAGIAGLGDCRGLEKLNLGGCVLVSNVNFVRTLRHLKELHLWMTRVRTEGIAGLSGCTSLVEVVFDGCIRLTNVSALGGLANLRFVSLSQTDVDMAGIEALQACPSLETLDVRGTRIEKPPKLFTREAVVTFFERFH